jgi:hypothetical protein
MLTLFAAAVALTLPLGAADKNYTDIKLVVTDAEKGTPVPRAAVTLRFAKPKRLRKDEKFEWDVKTDGRGQVTIPFVQSGKVRLLVFAKGYQTFGEDLTVSGEEQTIEVKLSRPAGQYSAHDTAEERKEKQKENPKKQ